MRKSGRFIFPVLTYGVALACVTTPGTQARAGQIASFVDEHGHTIYVNAADLPPAPNLTNKRSRRFARPGYIQTPPPEISNLVEKAADRHAVDPKLVSAIIQVESAYNPRAVSNKGAEGLMQLVPATAERFGVQNTFNPRQNIEGGVTYLRYLLDMFRGNLPLSLAAYNAGEHAVLRRGGIPPYAETVNYVQRVTDLYGPQTRNMLLAPQPRDHVSPTIYRTVDARGVVHYTNDDGL